MKNNCTKNRIRVLVGAMGIIMAVFAFRLARWQIVEFEDMKKASARTSTHIQKIESSRGEIVDRYGIPLAVNENAFDIILDKAFLFENDESVVGEYILSVLDKADRSFYDLLPISSSKPYEFALGEEKRVNKLKRKLGLPSYANAGAVMNELKLQFKLEGYDEETARRICGLRYTSSQKLSRSQRQELEEKGIFVPDKNIFAQFEENFVIESVLNILSKTKESHIDELPISKNAPYSFMEGKEREANRLKKKIGVGEYADAELVMFHLKEKYALEDFDEGKAREIAGIRYTMELKDFSLSIPYVFSEDIKTQTASIIMENSMKLKGAYVNEKEKRSYPNGDIAPHIIGQVGPIFAEEREEFSAEKGYALSDKVGKSGIEKTFEKELKGKDGKRQLVFDNRGQLTQVIELEPAIPGHTVALTIDSGMQRRAYDAIEKKITQLNQNAPTNRGKEADAGAVVAINVKTGEVLAAVNYPSFDLANYNKDFAKLSKDPRRPLWDRVLLGQYAPGSCFKPCVGVAALSEGLMKKEDTVFCGHTYTYYDDYRPTCVGNHGNIELTRALQESCNIYFFDVGRRLGTDTINKYARELGLGVETGVELPENVGSLSTPELFSSLRNGEQWTPGNVLQASIGQLDTRFTPIQIANYTATMANKGKRMKLGFVKSINSYNLDKEISKVQPEIAFDGTGNDYAFDSVKEGMIKASRIGTASYFFHDYPIDVASKTGSPQVSKEVTNAVFTCFAPADDPEIAVTVIIEKGCHGLYGAPVAKEVLDYYFDQGELTSPAIKSGELLP